MSIELKNISYTYMPKTPFEHLALDDISITIPEGKITAIAGHTGSGKSTLIQHFNGLLKPNKGTILVDGVDIGKKNTEAKAARRKVGIVFQYPEYQLFEETIAKDIAFGPRNIGCSEDETQERVKQAMDFVNLDYDNYAHRSPFQLSGGQKRRAAIAGILALQPKYLVLDEPTAGLDPKGRESLMEKFRRLHKEKGTTIVLISHNMDNIASYADNVIILNKGKVTMEATPEEAFSKKEIISQAGLELPEVKTIMNELAQNGLEIQNNAYTMDKAVEEIIEALRRKGKC
ncbi:MAG: energy-coupling factor transporter ATPase [Anaerovibrio sp.]|uniref:energy-coupling factor transporter ATPase n=1 Tax=Anaerovibrio sp. TaxID=1872532 RepID=UPI001B2783C0|nr:energy-coupling factor transporter ATPase [Anaerovibrio sp.]MBO6247132.1 energy-coupling factor transporter ATPase [Anaerovibrio sp.]